MVWISRIIVWGLSQFLHGLLVVQGGVNDLQYVIQNKEDLENNSLLALSLLNLFSTILVVIGVIFAIILKNNK